MKCLRRFRKIPGNRSLEERRWYKLVSKYWTSKIWIRKVTLEETVSNNIHSSLSSIYSRFGRFICRCQSSTIQCTSLAIKCICSFHVPKMLNSDRFKRSQPLSVASNLGGLLLYSNSRLRKRRFARIIDKTAISNGLYYLTVTISISVMENSV